jgi:DinB superfamily
MKKLLLLLPIFLLFSYTTPDAPLSKKERKFIAKHMKETYKTLVQSVKGLSEAQLNYKTAPDKWSIKECVYHLAISETNLWQWIQGTVKAPANPEKRGDIKMTDEQLLAGIEDRTNKVKTTEAFEPKNAKWNNVKEALAALKVERNLHIDYMKTTTDDMRSHVASQTPVGPLDSYQLVILLSSHTIRHTKQIEEIKADPNYPKN